MYFTDKMPIFNNIIYDKIIPYQAYQVNAKLMPTLSVTTKL